MKILDATIYGFGKWVDYKIDFSDATCIYGENESGKSTIQKFILFMLFGLTPKQREFYRPKTSGKMGGKMTILHPAVGEFRIERLDELNNGAAACFTKDGKTYDEAWLKEQLNGMTAKTYESIFSFSALDLTEIRNMKDEDLGEVLLGIGMTGSNNIYAVEKRLDAKIAELFKPTGKKPVMNQKIESLNRISDSLQSFREAEASYREKKENAAQLERELTETQQKQKDKKSLAFTIEKKLHALPVMQEHHKVKSLLEDYPERIKFPENGVSRLEKWKEALLPLQSEWNVVKGQEKNYKHTITEIEQGLQPEEISREAEDLLAEKERIQSKVSELKKLQTTVSQDEFQLNEAMDRLHLGIQVKELAGLEIPFYLEKAWTELKNETDQLKLESEQLDNEKKQLEQEKQYMNNQIEQLEGSILSDSHVHELRNRLDIFKSNQLMKQLKEDAKEKEKARNKDKQLASNLFIGSIIIALFAGIGAVMMDISWLYTVMLLVLVLGTGQWLMTKRTHKELDYVLQEYEQFGEQVTEAERREAEQLLEMQDTYKSEQAALQEQLKLGHIQYIKWNEKQNLLAERERRLEEQIRHQYESFPFLKQMEIAYWPELYHHLKHVVKLIKDWQKHIDEAAALEKQLKKIQQNIERFLAKQGIANPDERLEQNLQIIERFVNLQQEQRKELNYYKQLLTEIKEKQDELQQNMQTYKTEIEHLFKLAEVDAEELFYEKARLREEKTVLERELVKTTTQLKNLLSSEDIQKLEKTMVTEAELEMNRQQTESSIQSLESKLEKIRENLADTKAELVAMESSDSYSASLHQFEMETEHFNQLAKEWAVLKTAKEILSETKRNYRATYLSKVIEVTAQYFKDITDGKYPHVYPPTDSSPFQVESFDNIRYTVNELSQGTVDQLYVALRLAISEIMSEKHGLPFVIDDAFVHFDAVRVQKMITILQQAAAKQQVILFTCRKEIASAVTEMKQINITENVQHI
ncbi:AAA family ATPase [Oceanobacillus sp. FSL K6-2867]|uniref:ATP-binding protein n=1 Tax=Oceanobacillus sp. FSL K6-2867 TaxID=2954748 RepID=UPI0030D7315F